MGVDDPHEFAAGTEVSFLRRVGRAIRLARLFAYMNNLKGRREEVRRQRGLLTLAEQAADGTVDGDGLVERAQKLKRRKQSRIGALLSESIARKVILIVLILVSFVPQLVFSEENTIEQAAARSLHEYSSPGAELAVMWLLVCKLTLPFSVLGAHLELTILSGCGCDPTHSSTSRTARC